MSESKTNPVDKDLSDLLTSALADFSTEEASTDVVSTSPKAQPPPAEGEQGKEKEEEDEEWSEAFIKQAAEQFEANISALLCGGSGGDENSSSVTAEQLQTSFQRMAEAAQAALTDPGIDDPRTSEFANTISQTIHSLSQGAENAQSTTFNDADLLNMFQGAGAGEQNTFLPFMQGMMQSLLSKDVLYPSLKDILAKYPEWLQANESKLSVEERTKYEKQQELMQRICDELEGENEQDSTDEKKTRFEKVLAMMQTLQDYGQPPSDIVADVGPTLPFDGQGNPEQCCVC